MTVTNNNELHSETFFDARQIRSKSSNISDDHLLLGTSNEDC